MALKTQFSTSYVKDKLFWDSETFPHHQDLLALKSFRTLYESDTTPDKAVSSKILWSIYFIYDLESKYIVWDIDKRISYIEKDFLDNPGFLSNTSLKHHQLIRSCISDYESLQDNSVKRQLVDLDKKMDERRKFMNLTKYDATTWEMLDKMAKEGLSFAKQRKAIEDLVTIEEAKETKKGGKLSLFAQGKLSANYATTGAGSTTQEVKESKDQILSEERDIKDDEAQVKKRAGRPKGSGSTKNNK